MKSKIKFQILVLFSFLAASPTVWAQLIVAEGTTASDTMSGSPTDFTFISANTANYTGTPPGVYGGVSDQPSVLTDFTMSAVDPSAQNIWGGGSGYSQIYAPGGSSLVQTGVVGAAALTQPATTTNVNLANITLSSNTSFNYSDFYVYVMFDNIPGDGTAVDSAFTLSLGNATATMTVVDSSGLGGSDTTAEFAKFEVTGAAPGDVLTLGATADMWYEKPYFSGVSFAEVGAVPEPSTSALMMGGLLCLFGMIFHRARSRA